MEWSEAVVSRVQKSLSTQTDWHLEKIKQVLVASDARGDLKEGLNLDQVVEIVRSTYMGIVFSSLNKFQGGDIAEKIKVGLGFLFDGIKK